MTASIILAAGESRRMGAPKLLLEYQGKTLLQHAISNAQTVTAEVVVVVGAYPELYTAVAEAANARVVHNQAWRQGMGGSLQTGLRNLANTTEKTLVLLADQPFVPSSHLEQLLSSCSAQTPLVFSWYDGVQGPPAALQRQLFKQALALEPSCGLKTLIPGKGHVANITLAAWQDVDTPEDATALGMINPRNPMAH